MSASDTVLDLRVAVKRCPVCVTGFGVDAAFCPFDGVALEAGTWDPTRDPLTNAIVDNRYEVIEPLGEGGMGTVYKVRHVTLDRMFAMKVLRRDLAADEGLAARFMQEARATAAIHHPAVVAINDFGTLDDGAPFFVMELLVGETLATRMRARGLLDPREAAGIARRLADALGAAHAAKVIHRDLKPENVFLVGASSGKAPTDDVRIVDFGAAKIVGASKLTRPGVVFGTPYYMSPEQASGQPVDARADIYSLGVLLYEMLSGALPFEADTYMGVLTKHMFATAAKPSERVPSGAPLGALDAVVMRALEKEPSARYATMADFAEAIRRALEASDAPGALAEASAEAPAAPSRSGRSRPSQLSAADRIQRSVSRRVEDEARRKRRTIVIAVVAAVGTVGLGALAVSLLDRGERASEGAAAGITQTASASAATTTGSGLGAASPGVGRPGIAALVAPGSTTGTPPNDPAAPTAVAAAAVAAPPGASAAPGALASAPAGTVAAPTAQLAPSPATVTAPPGAALPVRPRKPAAADPSSAPAARPTAPPPTAAPKRHDEFADPWAH
jgi:serine/threonine-protein kinase